MSRFWTPPCRVVVIPDLSPNSRESGAGLTSIKHWKNPRKTGTGPISTDSPASGPVSEPKPENWGQGRYIRTKEVGQVRSASCRQSSDTPTVKCEKLGTGPICSDRIYLPRLLTHHPQALGQVQYHEVIGQILADFRSCGFESS